MDKKIICHDCYYKIECLQDHNGAYSCNRYITEEDYALKQNYHCGDNWWQKGSHWQS